MCYGGVHHAREEYPGKSAAPGRVHTGLWNRRQPRAIPETAERYINTITRYLKAVPHYAEADCQSILSIIEELKH